MSLEAALLKRELTIALRAPLTWLTAAVSALLVGHGFVLAVDLFSAASRSVGQSLLMAREMDPLAGVVRPTLGGLGLAVSLLAPLVAARALAIEKERHTLESLVLQVGRAGPVLRTKALAALTAASLQLFAPLALLVLWVALGGHLAAGETTVALLGHALHLGFVVALAIAASAFARTFAQAIAASLVVVVASWAIDASEGFAALAWLGQLLRYSESAQLLPFERGVLPLGGLVFYAGLSLGALALAFAPFKRSMAALAAGGLALAFFGAGWVRALDTSEAQRLSLPPAVVEKLRALPSAPRLEIELDRDDARRQELERDLLTRLRLAVPGAEIRFPPDTRDAALAEHTAGYGKLTIAVGEATRETYSTGRRELTTLIFEAAGQPLPSLEQPEYPGYPLVVDGARRSVVLFSAYFLIPALLAAAGAWACKNPKRRSTT